jgi:hypothetical protein
MSKAARAGDICSMQSPRTGDGDILHFLTRTLQAHIMDAEPQDVLEKLENLKTALAQQEITLAAWPASRSKDRICAALARAISGVTQIVDDIRTGAHRNADACILATGTKSATKVF